MKGTFFLFVFKHLIYALDLVLSTVSYLIMTNQLFTTDFSQTQSSFTLNHFSSDNFFINDKKINVRLVSRGQFRVSKAPIERPNLVV